MRAADVSLEEHSDAVLERGGTSTACDEAVDDPVEVSLRLAQRARDAFGFVELRKAAGGVAVPCSKDRSAGTYLVDPEHTHVLLHAALYWWPGQHDLSWLTTETPSLINAVENRHWACARRLTSSKWK